MRTFRITRLSEPDNSAWRLYRIRDTIQTDPDYQRSSDIWNEEKKQLIIDTILNGFDVPKLYFHKFPTPLKQNGSQYEYAIIDGKQRLEALWGFIEGDFALSRDFECLWDPSMDAAGMTYTELAKNFPDLKNSLDSYPLTIICIETDDVEIIEDMFSRLNEAVPLSAAEKRNAKGGPIPMAIKTLSASPFFTSRVPFKNNRYRHYDLAIKFLISEENGKVTDTKKRTLDRYVEEWANNAHRDTVVPALAAASQTLADMAAVFTEEDKLLRQVGTVVLYFHLFRIARNEGWTNKVERRVLEKFEEHRVANRKLAELGGEPELELIEFDRYAQSSNDSYAIRIRLRILLKFAFGMDKNIEDL